MCANTREYLEEVLKEQKAGITIRAEDVSFWVVVTDPDLFSCLQLKHQQHLISTSSDNLPGNNSLADLVDKAVFKDYYHIITDETDREIVSDSTVRNERDSDYKLIDNRVAVLLSLLRTLTDKSVLVDVVECTTWFIGSPDRLFHHLSKRYGNSIVQAFVDLHLKGIYVRATLDIVQNLTAQKVMKMRMNDRNTSELMEKHEVWISELQRHLDRGLSEQDFIHVVGFISKLSSALQLYKNTVLYDRYLQADQVLLIKQSIYRLNSTIISSVLRWTCHWVKRITIEQSELMIEILANIKILVKRVRISSENSEDFGNVVRKIATWDGTYIIDVMLDVINSSCSQNYIQKEGLQIIMLSLDILNNVSYVPRSPNVNNNIAVQWATELQKWRNEMLYSATVVLEKFRSILIVEKCSRILRNVLIWIPDLQNDLQKPHEQISERLVICSKVLLNDLSANQIECPLETHDRLLFSASAPSSDSQSSLFLETRSQNLSSGWQRMCWLFNTNKNEYVNELKKRLLECLKSCINFNERNTGQLTIRTSRKIIREIRRPTLECILNLPTEILDKATVTEITRLTYTLLIRIPRFLSNIPEEDGNIGEMNTQIRPLIPILLEFAIKHNNHAMAYLTMWYTSSYFNINMANLQESVYLSNEELRDVGSQNSVDSITDFEQEVGAIVTFLEKCANFEPSQHNLAMEKLRAHTKVLLNSIADPKAKCQALTRCQELWEKLSQVFLKVPFESHTIGIFFDIINEISCIHDKKIGSSIWRDRAIRMFLKSSNSSGLQLRDIIRNSLHVHRILDRNKICYLSVVKMLSSLVSGSPYFYPRFIDKKICLALLGNLRFIRESGKSYKNEELDDIVSGTAKILRAWGCNYPNDCLKAFDKTSRELILLLQHDSLEIKEFYKQYLEERDHKCYIMTSIQECRMQLFQFNHYCDCFQQWFMIFFGLINLIADILSHRFHMVNFLLNLKLFMLSFSSMIYANYMSFEARMRHNRETFTSDTSVWEGEQFDDGSTTFKNRMRYYLIPFSNNFMYNVYCFLQMRLILDVKEILSHKPQLIRVLQSKIRNLSTLKLYLKLGGIASVILQSLVIANRIQAADTIKELLPNKQDANETIHSIKSSNNILNLFSSISNSPLKLKIQLGLLIVTLLWSSYSTGASLATYERNSSSSRKRHFKLLTLHYFVAISCRLVLLNLLYSVSGTSTLLLVGGNTLVSFLLNIFYSHKYHDPALDEEKQKSTPQRPIWLVLKRSSTRGEALSIVLRLLIFSVSETLIVFVRYPIDFLQGSYHEWHEKDVFDLAPTFLLHIAETMPITAILDPSYTTTFTIVSILYISSWTLLAVYLLARTRRGNEWELEEVMFCDEAGKESDDENYGV